MIADHAELPSAISPDELTMLQRVFDHVCRQRAVYKQSGEATRIAATLLDVFQSGIRGEKQLLAMMSVDPFYP